MIIIRPFRQSDLQAFTPIEALSEAYDPAFAKAIEDSHLSVAGVNGNTVVGCGGVHPVNAFHGELWLRLSDWCLTHRIATARWLMCGLKIIEETYPFKQLNAHIKDGFRESISLLKRMGFTEVEEQVNGNQKYIVFAKRVRE